MKILGDNIGKDIQKRTMDVKKQQVLQVAIKLFALLQWRKLLKKQK